jgi:mono/diheme cytochrome c family protein
MSSTPDSNFRLEQACASDDSIQQIHAQLQKQKPDKAHGYSFLPLGILGLMCSAVFFSSIYLAHYSIRFDPLVVNENARREKPGAVAAPVVTPAMLGKRVFTTICQVCHQPNGQGLPGVYPPLAGSEWAQGSEERIIRIVLLGLNGPITVEGKDFNNAMAPLGVTLKDDQIANALTYVRQEWGNKAPEVKAETVARIRAEIGSRTQPWTVPELLKVGN